MKIDKDNQEIIDSYDYLSTAASTTECTGLIPSLALSEQERESYETIFHFEPPKLNEQHQEEKDN